MQRTSIFLRRFTTVLFKYPAEVGRVVVADTESYFGKAQLRVGHQFTGFVDTYGVDKLGTAHPHDGFHFVMEAAAAQV